MTTTATFTPDPDLIERARNPERGPDGRLPTRDRVETAIVRPGPFPATGWYRDELLRRREQSVADLAATDAELGALVQRRRALTERIRGCNLALTGTGEVRDSATGETSTGWVIGTSASRSPIRSRRSTTRRRWWSRARASGPQ